MISSYRLWFHARIQMQRRHITLESIEETLSQPDEVQMGDHGRRIMQKLIMHQGASKLLRLVVETNEQGEREVVTLYITSKIRKYWKGH